MDNILALVRRKFNNLHLCYQLFIVLFLLNIIDYITTVIMIHNHGFDVEQNPILLYLLYETNTPHIIIIFKLFVLSFVLMLLNVFDDHDNFRKNITIAPLSILTLIYFLVCVGNFTTIILT